MFFIWYCLQIAHVSSVAILIVLATDFNEVCQSDYFRASCPDLDDVIMLTHAHYGRMRINKCATENFGYLGCSNDVLEIMDSYCSGRRECSIRILDENFPNTTPCHDDLKSYLEVAYECIQVITPNRLDCQQHRPIYVTNTTGYLASITSAETGCGTADAPWSIFASPGQRINVTLLDFTIDQSTRADFNSHPRGPSRVCTVYATIRELDGRRSVTVCGGEQRQKTVYVSLESSVEIRIINSQPEIVNFLIRFDVIGCPDVKGPIGGWVKNNEDSAIFGCNSGAETWEIICDGGRWVGEFRNCSVVSAQIEEMSPRNGMNVFDLPIGLSILVIVSLALSIWFVILTVGLACLKKKRREANAISCDNGGGCYIHHTRLGRVVVCPKHALVSTLRDDGQKTATSLYECKQQPSVRAGSFSASGGQFGLLGATEAVDGRLVGYGSLGSSYRQPDDFRKQQTAPPCLSCCRPAYCLTGNVISCPHYREGQGPEEVKPVLSPLIETVSSESCDFSLPVKDESKFESCSET